ncbi:MAG: hypothetical protein UU08_C0002G0045 [Candidatus Uhrbacteria bacterium GW2011_GWE2_40_58]|nr:MAG: hypothetical protein UT94_C0003G0029 [Candidatus Uhrbacteria bacterium GW2011_GWF2_40_263]KKR68194.1 MAG: hypothetical protein UU08_C0002G0045 [Candidatus Uhrbacteria bacterium GW2011_GWE2_40_58]
MTEKKSPSKKKIKTVPKKLSVQSVKKITVKPIENKKEEGKTSHLSPKEKPLKKKTFPAYPPSLNLYRHIAIGFVLVVITVLFAVLYVSTMKATIIVDSVHEVVSSEFVVDITLSPIQTQEIRGKVIKGAVSRTQTFVPSGEGVIELEEIATGVVTLYNTSTSSQPLVKTTRLLSPEGVLFRLNESVTIPQGGSVTVEVYADEKGASGNIEPTTFTIPGLSETKQALIYAESTESFTGGIQTQSVVTQEELEASTTSLQMLIEEEVKLLLRTEMGEAYSGEVYSQKEATVTYSIEPNTQVDQYDVTISLEMIGVFYDQEALAEIAQKELTQELGKGREFIEMNLSEMSLVLDHYNLEEEKASLHVELEGKVITSRTSEALKVERFVGMTKEEVNKLLLEEGVATTVSVEFFPFWVRHVPRLKDHIYIEIQ